MAPTNSNSPNWRRRPSRPRRGCFSPASPAMASWRGVEGAAYRGSPRRAGRQPADGPTDSGAHPRQPQPRVGPEPGRTRGEPRNGLAGCREPRAGEGIAGDIEAFGDPAHERRARERLRAGRPSQAAEKGPSSLPRSPGGSGWCVGALARRCDVPDVPFRIPRSALRNGGRRLAPGPSRGPPAGLAASGGSEQPGQGTLFQRPVSRFLLDCSRLSPGPRNSLLPAFGRGRPRCPPAGRLQAPPAAPVAGAVRVAKCCTVCLLPI
jgi:hypothetical protein